MPSDKARVVHHAGHDYWRTWFLEECEAHHLFGINEKHLPLLTNAGFKSYRPGTRVFLDDAPYFRATRTHHRVCGPYEVVPATIPPDAERPGWIPFLHDRTHDLLSSADAILTASGTATVEAAIYGVPMVVTYWIHPLAALTVGPFLKVRNFAMVNILAGRRIVPELYQFKARPKLLAGALSALLPRDRAATVRWHLQQVADSLGPPGASRRAAEHILKEMG